MSPVERINALIRKAEDLETRAEDGNKRLLEEIAKAYGEATQLAEKHLGSLSDETLNLRERWADSVRSSGNLAEATNCHLRNVEWTLKSLEQHQRQRSSSERIASAQERHLYAQRQLAETHLANKKFSEAVNLYEDILTSNAIRSPEDLYKDRADLASALFSTGSDRNIMRAVNLNAETLQKADQNLGRSHVETVRIRFNLARELYSLEKYSDASEKYEELLRILEAKGCKARSDPDYHAYLEDTKISLKNCSIRIAQQQGEWRKAEKSRRKLENQMEEKKSASQERDESSASAHRADKKPQVKKPAKGEPSEARESQRSQVTSNSKQFKQASGRSDRESTEERPAKENRSQVAERSSRVERRIQMDEPTKESNKAFTKPRKHDTREDSSEHQSNTRPKADHTTTASVADLEPRLTNKSSNGPEKRNSKSRSVVDHSRATDVSKSTAKSDGKCDLPIRPRSASDALSPHSIADTETRKINRSNSTRSDIGRSKRDIDHNGGSNVSREWQPDEKSTKQKEPAPRVLKNDEDEQEQRDRTLKTKPEKRQSSSASTSVKLWWERRRESDVMSWVMENPAHSTSEEQEHRLERKKEKHDNWVSPQSHERSSEQKISRRPSAPSIVLSKPEFKETKSPENMKPRSRNQADRERPRSSQSDYCTAPSPLSIVNMDIEKRKERRSRSSDPTQVPSLPRIGDETEIFKRRSSAAQTTSKKPPTGDDKAEQQPLQPSEQSERKQTEKNAKDPTEPPKKLITEKPAPELNPIQAEDKPQQPYLWVDAHECFEPTDPGNEDVRRQSSVVEASQVGVAQSDVKPSQSKSVEPAELPEPVPIISTDPPYARRTEHIVPGGWHQDFDEPDLSHTIRKVRSNDALSQGGLRVSQASDAGHRRAASVDISRPTLTPKKAPPIKDWSYIDEVIADEWFDRLRENTHVFLDKYHGDCYGVSKTARRVRIAVLDTGVAKSTAKGPVPPLMKGPRVKIGKVLDASLPWNMDSKGHGTHAAGLILNVCPYADVYVYRVCEGTSAIDKQHVADAILDAVDKKKVDIISLSLGWEDNSHIELWKAVLHARASGVLLFAASSNEGVRTKAGMAFPARAPEVIAIDAADVHGRPLRSNPPGTRNQGRARLTALGEAVRSTWPMDLATEDAEPGWKRLAGTSCATPIAAGIAGLVLEFARQRPMCFERAIETYLKTVEGMHLALRHLLSVECDTDPRFNNLDPTKLFHVTNEDDDGGDWAKPLCPRWNAATDIVKVLRNEYGQEIGLAMSTELERELGRRYR